MVGELQAGNSQLSAPVNADDPSQRRKRWRLAWLAVCATLLAACGGAPSVQPTPHLSSLSNPTTGTMPIVLGMTLGAARSALSTAGYDKYSWQYDCYGSPDIGQVVKQVPGGGTHVERSTYVKVFLQADNCTATVPKVIGTSLSAAIPTLQRAGFPHVHWIFKCLGSSNGTVVIQSPEAGASYPTNK